MHRVDNRGTHTLIGTTHTAGSDDDYGRVVQDRAAWTNRRYRWSCGRTVPQIGKERAASLNSTVFLWRVFLSVWFETLAQS